MIRFPTPQYFTETVQGNPARRVSRQRGVPAGELPRTPPTENVGRRKLLTFADKSMAPLRSTCRNGKCVCDGIGDRIVLSGEVSLSSHPEIRLAGRFSIGGRFRAPVV